MKKIDIIGMSMGEILCFEKVVMQKLEEKMIHKYKLLDLSYDELKELLDEIESPKELEEYIPTEFIHIEDVRKIFDKEISEYNEHEEYTKAEALQKTKMKILEKIEMEELKQK